MSKAELARAWVLVVSIGLAACDKRATPAVSASSFPATCVQGGDCKEIYEGDLTCCGATSGCPNAAIRQDVADAYDLEVSRGAPKCGAQTKCATLGDCGGGLLTCPHGRCVFTPWSAARDDAPAGENAITAADYARGCTDVADCKAVYEGALGCCDNGCPNTAIRLDAYAQYEKDIRGRVPVCVPAPGCVPPSPCASGRLACTNGTCELLLQSP